MPVGSSLGNEDFAATGVAAAAPDEAAKEEAAAGRKRPRLRHDNARRSAASTPPAAAARGQRTRADRARRTCVKGGYSEAADRREPHACMGGGGSPQKWKARGCAPRRDGLRACALAYRWAVLAVLRREECAAKRRRERETFALASSGQYEGCLPTTSVGGAAFDSTLDAGEEATSQPEQQLVGAVGCSGVECAVECRVSSLGRPLESTLGFEDVRRQIPARFRLKLQGRPPATHIPHGPARI
jgi:hypothetical protein